MIAPVIIALVSLLLHLWDVIVRPQRATCPAAWYAEGVRPSGETTCRPAPPPNCGEPTGEYTAPCPDDERELQREIYCTGGTQPIVVDSRTVGCQPRH